MNDIAFIDLAAQQKRILQPLEKAMQTVLAHGQYILGPEVQTLEKELQLYSGATHVISCANGTDAITLALLAKNVAPNDVIFVPSFTFAATAEAVAFLGAIPFFVDVVDDTFTMCPASLEQAIIESKKQGLTPKGIIAVDLFGHPADYIALNKLADHYQLFVMADAAQSFGAKIQEKSVGSLCEISTTSFFPAKVLGCYGDGGAIFLNSPDDNIAKTLRSLRGHGTGNNRYHYIAIGMNSRLDTLQAAILLEKLKIFDEEHAQRCEIADFYESNLNTLLTTPKTTPGYTHNWGYYTLQSAPTERTLLINAFEKAQIPYMIYYQNPLHLQTPYAHFPKASSLAITERLMDTVLSIPMHPYLKNEQLQHIVEVIHCALT